MIITASASTQVFHHSVRTTSKSLMRILLVEDNDASRQLMSDYLEYHGYSVHALSHGAFLGAAMTQVQPDLILLDLKLPDIDGFSLLQQIQQRPDWSSIPVIVVSAYAFIADQQRAFELGARRYLVKPVNLKQLKRTIAEELGLPVV